MTMISEEQIPTAQVRELMQAYFGTFLPNDAVTSAMQAFEREYPIEDAIEWLHESSENPRWQGLIVALRCGQLLPRPSRLILGQVYGSEQLGAVLARDFANLEQEQLQLLCLDTKNQVIKRQVVFQGTLNSCPAQPREIIKVALTTPTARVVIAHNHPSGDVTPSKKDVEFTKRLQLACELMGLPLLDSFIIGVNDYFNFAEQGVLNCNTDS
ncbi:JAB domain-containing protein [Lactiplantibacillus plantarum]|uniref:JAB domain-containing protein n=1 Tax=Lactiplantibacillus plantarum TaxID=1590 RepID=UPI000A20C040|nr:JAB domain-containing protein [Lactiplantibacillus plantarum]ARO01078.1 DNA repair protein [Lactiplantibacillus plantarum]ARO03983.1 DNA repair protein [Lactiplantibacillus plantarum]